MSTPLKLLWLVVVQLISLLAMLLGWVILIPFCIAQAWETSPIPSIKDGKREIDRWSWGPLNLIYGNPEDGVSGKTARLIDGSRYLPTASDSWRGYLWSAWRNSADNLKYVFAYESGPLYEFRFLGKTLKIGWQKENGYKVPVLSIG